MTAHNPAAFRAIVWKELRHSWKWAGLCFVIVCVMLLIAFGIAGSGAGLSGAVSLLSSTPATAFTAALTGALIGLSQMLAENRGDAWAFLMHRPLTRSQLFWAKVLAGVMMYAAAFGIPVLFTNVWAATPGHLPTPFDIRMSEPSVADFLCGLVYYLGALLVAMRNARWIGSRPLGIIAGMIATSMVVGQNEFSRAFAADAVALIVVGAAAWGTFVAGGEYEPQPTWSRAAVALITGAGWLALGAVGLGIAEDLPFMSSPFTMTFTTYAVTSDGSIVQTVRNFRGIVSVKRLDGGPATQYATAGARDTMSKHVLSTSLVVSSERIPWNGGYRSIDDMLTPLSRAGGLAALGPSSNDFVVPQDVEAARVRLPSALPNGGDSLWYYVHRPRLIEVYDHRSARHVGWMGPGGFVAGDAPPPPFTGAFVQVAGDVDGSLLALHDAVYRLDVRARRITRVFAGTDGDSVIAVGESAFGRRLSDDAGRRAHFSVIATLHRLYVLNDGDSVAFSVPFSGRASKYGDVEVSHAVGGVDRFVIMNSATRGPTIATQLTPAGQQLAQFPLPRDTSRTATVWFAPLTHAVTTPLAVRISEWLQSRQDGSDVAARTATGEERARDIAVWVVALLSGIFCAALLNWCSRRNAFAPRRVWLWTAIAFLLGPAALALFFSIMPWPAKVDCPSCRRLRVVTREQCEHCGAMFPAPAADGTEIFEPVGVRA